VEPFLRGEAEKRGVAPGPALQKPSVIIHTDTLERARSQLLCPVCLEPLELLNYGYDSDVVLERCAGEHGLWLPDDSLEALAAFVKGHESIEPVLKRMRSDRSAREESERAVDDTLYRISALVPAAPLIFLPYDTENEEAPTAAPPRVGVGLLILANVLIYTLQPADPAAAARVFHWFGLVPAVAWLFWWMFVTAMFLHVGFWHLFGNMTMLWITGRDLEADLGTRGFLELYLKAGLFGNLLSMLSPHPDAASLGASGAVAGLFSAFIRRFPNARIATLSTVGRRSVSARLFFGVWFSQQIWIWLRHPGWHIGWLAHIGGFVAGWLLVQPREDDAAPAGSGVS